MILTIKQKQKPSQRLIKKFVWWRRINENKVVIFQTLWIHQNRVVITRLLPFIDSISYWVDQYYYLNEPDSNIGLKL